MNTSTSLAQPHLLITASAGSGKTWRLARRIAALILAGEDPNSIVALTFTRKAAGEFFEQVLSLFAQAASDPAEAARIGQELTGRPAQPADFIPHLRCLTQSLHRLSFTTIDSFFHRIVAAFPLELGISANFTLMDDFATRRARLDTLEHLFRNTPSPASAQKSFLESFKLSTFGKEEKSVSETITDFADNYYQLFLDAPHQHLWDGSQLTSLTTSAASSLNAQQLTQQIASLLPSCGGADRVDFWNKIAPCLADWQPGTSLSSSAQTVRKNILDAVKPGDQTCDLFNLNRKKIDPAQNPALGTALYQLALIWAQRALHTCIQRTHGTFLILQAYHQIYDQLIRRTGRLVFNDLPRLIGSTASAGLSRLDLDYRLDARFHHWLLDEFQDTSRSQWAVLQNLVDEVLQDPEKRRTFFCVGDRKQSIYAWRGGDHRIFSEIQSKYHSVLSTESLTQTYRCAPAIIEMVNHVMGQQNLDQLLGPGGKDWQDIWQTHQSARTDGPGFAAYLEADKPDKDSEHCPRHQAIAEIIKQIQPTTRGWTCAVLVRTNDEALTIADFLRAEMPETAVVLEGQIQPALDNTLGLGLIAWCRALLHPLDTLALGWLTASPAASAVNFSSHHWRTAAFASIARHGLLHTVRQFLEQLVPANSPHLAHPFLTLRRRQILQAVRNYTETYGQNPHQLENFLRHHTLKTTPAPGSVQVMTIHQAKGLGFDLVIVTELIRQNFHLNRPRSGPLIQHHATTRQIQWICETPEKAFLPFFPEIQKVADQHIAENIFEQLCLLYVAMTRARHALYLIGERRDNHMDPKSSQSSDSKTIHLQDIVTRALASTTAQPNGKKLLCGIEAIAAFGNEPSPPSSSPSASSPQPATGTSHPHVPYTPPPSLRLRPQPATSPSTASPWREDTSTLLTGRHLHQLLAGVQRLTPQLLDTFQKNHTTDPALPTLLACLQAPALQPIFQPPADVTIWIEQPFQAVLDTGAISGVFDRVHLHPGPDGSWSRAEIFDYKTDPLTADQIPNWVEKYRPQLLTYRAALARLTRLPESSITCTLISTTLQRPILIQ